MARYKKCISCLNLIIKSAKSNHYLCRSCEQELTRMAIAIPDYHRYFER